MTTWTNQQEFVELIGYRKSLSPSSLCQSMTGTGIGIVW